MTDEHLRESLQRLPEAGAGEGFTRAVLARLAEADAGVKDHATSPDGPRHGPRLGGLSLQALAPRLAAAAAVMVVATVLALALIPMLNGPGSGETAQPATVAESTSPMDANPDVASAPADRPFESVAAPVAEPVTVPATESATESAAERVAAASDLEPRSASDAVREAAPGAASGAVPAATDTGNPADTVAPAAQPRTLDPEERRRAVERLRQLRREQERLRTRLAALSEAPAPTLVLGGDESLELVLDLSADAGRPGGGGGYGALPASYRPQPDNQLYFH